MPAKHLFQAKHFKIIFLATLTSILLIGFAFEHQNFTIALSEEVQPTEQQKTKADRLVQQAERHLSASQYKLAEDLFKQALSLYRSVKDIQGEENTLRRLENTYLVQREFRDAEEFTSQLVELETQKRRALIQRASNFKSLPEDEKRVVASQLVIQGDKAFASWRGQFFWKNIAISPFKEQVSISNQDSDKAIVAWKKALEIYQSLQDLKGQEDTLFKLGIAYSEKEEQIEAINYFEKLVAIYQKLLNLKLEGRILGLLSKAHSTLVKAENDEHFRKAVEYSQKSLVIAQNFKDWQYEALAFWSIADVYKRTSIYNQEIENLQKVLKIFEDIQGFDNPQTKLHHIEKVLWQLGAAYENLGDSQEAIKTLNKLLERIRAANKNSGKVTFNSLEGMLTPESTYLLRYLSQEGSILTEIGRISFESADVSSAEKNLRDALGIWEILRVNLSKSLYHEGQAASTISAYLEQQIYTYKLLEYILVSQGKVDSALEITERERARSLVESLHSFIRDLSIPSSRGIENNLTIRQIIEIANKENSVLIVYSILPDLNFRNKPSKTNLLTWIVKPTGEITFREADLESWLTKRNMTLRDFMRSARLAIGARGPSIEIERGDVISLQTKLQDLHELLIEPIEDLLPTDSQARITFIPQRELFLVPFAALRNKSGEYLIKNHTLSISPSIRTLAVANQEQQLQRARQNNQLSALVVGNPTTPRSLPSFSSSEPEVAIQFSPLLSAEQEANVVAGLFKTKALIGDNATKPAVLRQISKSRVIHLATHGYLDAKSVWRNAVVLSPSKEKISEDSFNSALDNRALLPFVFRIHGTLQLTNGFLTADEISRLSLSAELVVLSACDTGQGLVLWDGVLGLFHAFLMADTPTTIVSLWAIPDAPTAELMVEFYRNWLQRKMSKAQALRQAMLTTMKIHPNPRDWAAFTLIGEAE